MTFVLILVKLSFWKQNFIFWRLIEHTARAQLSGMRTKILMFSYTNYSL